MEIKPIKTARRNYPTLQDTLEKPELLEKNAPSRWLKNGAVAGALSTFILLGCNHEYPPDQKEALDSIVAQFDRNIYQAIKERLLVHRIAPIFVHGDGVGSIGCIAHGSIVYISEAEARGIIIEEFQRYGIELDTINTPTITLPADTARSFQMDIAEVKKEENIPYKIDAVNHKLNLVVDYVSSYDIERLREAYKPFGTITEFGTIYGAKNIRDSLIKIDSFHSAIFYDPLEYIKYLSEDKNENTKQAKNITISKIKAQVADFIAWAKKEGLIN